AKSRRPQHEGAWKHDPELSRGSDNQEATRLSSACAELFMARCPTGDLICWISLAQLPTRLTTRARPRLLKRGSPVVSASATAAKLRPSLRRKRRPSRSS